jgi:hypothetical protein
MTDEDLRQKFAMLAGPVIGAEPAREMIDMIARIDEVPDVSALLALAGPREG